MFDVLVTCILYLFPHFPGKVPTPGEIVEGIKAISQKQMEEPSEQNWKCLFSPPLGGGPYFSNRFSN